MIDTGADAQQSNNIPQLVKTIENNCTNDAMGGIFPFAEATTPTPDNKEKQAEYAGNVVFDGMMMTFAEIGAFAGKKAQENTPSAKGYETVVRAMDPLSQVCRGLSEDKIPLAPRDKKNAQGEVHAYQAKNFTLDGTPFKEVNVFVRTANLKRPIGTRDTQGGSSLSIAETAPAKMAIEVIPADVTQSGITIRVDREDALRDYEITYDIAVAAGGMNVMDRLDFSQDHATTQRQGHHFSSALKAEDFGVTFPDILQAFNEKFQKVAAATPPPQTQT